MPYAMLTPEQIAAAKQAIECAARPLLHRVGQSATVVGLRIVGPVSWWAGAAIVVQVATDQQRDRLAADPTLAATLAIDLRRAGFTAQQRQVLNLSFASQETVDRDWDGSWYRAFQ